MKYLMIFSLLLLLVNLSASQLDDIYNNVIAEYGKINSFEAVLNQNNFWSEIDLTKTATGRIYYNSDSLYINYLPPDQQELFVLGNTVIVHDIKGNQAIFMDKGDFFIRPVEIIKAYWADSDKEFISSSANSTQIVLKKDQEEILISLKNGLIFSVQITDKDNNSVSYQFSEEIINGDLPKGIFTPDFPENTNIIDNRSNGE